MRHREAIPVLVLVVLLLLSVGSLNPDRPVSLDRGWWANGGSVSRSVAASALEMPKRGLPAPPEVPAIRAVASPPVTRLASNLGPAAGAAAAADRWVLLERGQLAWMAAPAPPPEKERPKRRERWPDRKAILTEPPRPQPEPRRGAEQPATAIGSRRREPGDRQWAEFRSRPEAAVSGAGRMMACDRNGASDVIHPDGRRPGGTGRQGWA